MLWADSETPLNLTHHHETRSQIQQAPGGLAHHEERHQILEHRARPRDEGRPATYRRQGSAQQEPVAG
jgi:hypothetical protein